LLAWNSNSDYGGKKPNDKVESFGPWLAKIPGGSFFRGHSMESLTPALWQSDSTRVIVVPKIEIRFGSPSSIPQIPRIARMIATTTSNIIG
jgi:hypothetical protein